MLREPRDFRPAHVLRGLDCAATSLTQRVPTCMHDGFALSEPTEIARLGQPRDAELIWEYPRETPHGDQVDLIESIDVVGGRIARHRVYWGWVGFRTLVAAMRRAESSA